jgi:hypothetical protein
LAGWYTTPTRSTVSISDSRFEGNIADNAGGALNIATLGLTTLRNTAIIGNQVKALTNFANVRSGGGISVGLGDFLMDGCTISSNQTAGKGGGLVIYQQDPTLQTSASKMNATINNSTVSGNTAGVTGGAISLYGNVKTSLNSSTVTNNSALGGKTGGYSSPPERQFQHRRPTLLTHS